MLETKLGFKGGSVTYDSQGVYLKPFFSANSVFISWKKIDFVATTPYIELKESAWKTRDEINLMTDEGFKKLTGLSINIILVDRIEFIKGQSFYVVWWLLYFLNFKPLYIEDKPEKTRGVITLELKSSSLSHPINELLNLFEKNTKFDLLNHDV